HVSPSFFILSFFYHSDIHYRALHSFPTRRSSDLKMIHQLPTDADYVDVKVYLEGSQIGLSVIQTLIKDFNLDVNVIYASMSDIRSEEHTSELQSRFDLVCRLLLDKKN